MFCRLTTYQERHHTPTARVILLFLGVLTTALTSCDPGRVYDRSVRIPDHSWNEGKPLTFHVTIEDTGSTYDMSLLVRNTTAYAYANLYLFLTTTDPAGRPARDTLECLLAAPDGRWLGKGMGRIRDNRYLIKRGIRFGRSGVWTFTLAQAMREESLQGITDAGIRIEKGKPEPSR